MGMVSMVAIVCVSLKVGNPLRDVMIILVEINIYLSGRILLKVSIDTDHMNRVCPQCDSFMP